MRRLLGVRCAAAGCLVLAGCLMSSSAAAASRWSVQRALLPAGSRNASLQSVSCSSKDACMAVGWFVPEGMPVTALSMALVERWNGSKWSIQRTPRRVGANLQGVSCTSPRACTAVGQISLNTGESLPLVERWNGARWSMQRVPKRLGFLDDVSCTSRRTCVATGQFVSARWNGSRWSELPPQPKAGIWFGLSCVSANDCQATGSTNNNGNFAARWDGVSWKREQIPTPYSDGNDDYELDGVSCVSATACISVGVSSNLGDCGCGALTMAERWNGSSWSVMHTRNPGTNNDALNGVSCTSPTACIAVGSSATDLSAVLAERWNGSSWAVLPTTRGVQCFGDLCDTLNAVSCTSANACIAVGALGDGLPYAPLVARYSQRRR
jgi:hypothetical protein